MARILVIEDESVMAEALALGLRRHGYLVDTAADGRTGLELLEQSDYDVVLLDRDLPQVHGDEVCATLVRSANPARILMLTAAHQVTDRVEGLRRGADDYLAKPFAFDELLARVEALERRSHQRVDAPLRVGDIVIDPARRTVTRGDRDIALTVKEFGVLLELARQPGVLISAEQLLDTVWDENADPFTIAVRVTMSGLRKKLGEPAVISTLRGVGYRMGRPL
jgi:DNA-binding response OmpR family regulator